MSEDDLNEPPNSVASISADKASLDQWLFKHLDIPNPTASQRQKIKELILGKRASYKGYIVENGKIVKKPTVLSDDYNKPKSRKIRNDKGKSRRSHKPYRIWVDHTRGRLVIWLDMESEKISLYEIEDSIETCKDLQNVELTCDYLSIIEEETGLIIYDNDKHVNRIMLPIEDYEYGTGTIHWGAYAEYKNTNYSHGEVSITPLFGNAADEFFTNRDTVPFDLSEILKCRISPTNRYDIADVTGVSYD